MKSRKMSEKEAFDRLPVRFQQAVLVVANIVKRIAKQREQLQLLQKMAYFDLMLQFLLNYLSICLIC